LTLEVVLVSNERQSVELRLRAAVESSPSGLLMIDGSGAIVLVNREIERLFGYSREELLGRPVDVLVPERFRAHHPMFRADFLRDPRMRSMGAGRELYGLRKDGSEVPVEIGLTPVATDEGLFVLSAVVDISARKLAEEQRRELEVQLRHAQKMDAIGTLAGGIAHDFNNILTAILWFGEAIQPSVASDNTARGDLEEVLRAAQRGKELVDRILRFSRRQEALRVPQPLSPVVGEACRLLRATLPASIDIRLQVPPSEPNVLSDTTSVHQVVMNLGTNAAQAMPKGGVLEVGLESMYVRDRVARQRPGLREGAYVRLKVRDSGVGIDPSVRDRVFEPFFTTKELGRGTGLGLSVVHAIIRDHGGAIFLTSEVGLGTTVECFFPAIAEPEAPAIAAPDAATPGKGERVLFVDDEPSIARFAARHMTANGYEITAETDPQRALALVRDDPTRFQLVITDHQMPHLSGLELASEIRKLSPTIPIVLLSGHVDELDSAELKRVGIASVAQKPIRPSDLVTLAADALRGK
jgi:PAS domain S-box-containing protein